MTVAVSGARITWICTELIGLWSFLPILLWTDTLPVIYRIAVLAVAAAYPLWIVWFELHGLASLGSGPTSSTESLLGAPALAPGSGGPRDHGAHL